jgi:hypothetical protein
MNFSVLFLLSLFLSLCSSDFTPQRKQLAGLPSEFDLHVLPDPTEGGLSSFSALIPIDLNSQSVKQVNGKDEYVWSQVLPVDAETFVFAFASPNEENLKVSLYDANGNSIDLSTHAESVSFVILTCPSIQQHFLCLTIFVTELFPNWRSTSPYHCICIH